jgi:uncharacterized membrane protein
MSMLPAPTNRLKRGNLLVGAFLLGAATGLRSTSGLAAVVIGADPQGLPSFLRGRPARTLVALGTLSELVIDKLPATGSRLDPGPLAGRIVLGGLAGGLFARGRRHPVLPAVAVGAVAALVSAKVGHDSRVALAKRVSDPVAAVMEDLTTGTLAIGAVRLI